MGKLARKKLNVALENGKPTGTREEYDFIEYRSIRLDHWRTFKDNLPLGWEMSKLLNWILSTMTYADQGQYAYPSGVIFAELGISRAAAYRELDKLCKLGLICKVNGYRKIQVNPFYFGKGTLKEILNLRLSYLNGTPVAELATTAKEVKEAEAETGADDEIPY